MASTSLRVASRIACRRGLLPKQSAEAIQHLLCRRLYLQKVNNTELPRVSRDAFRLFSTRTAVCEQHDNREETKQDDRGDNGKANEEEWNRSVKEAVEKARREMEQQGGQSPEPKASKERGDRKEDEDYLTTLGRVMMELPTQLEGFFERGLVGTIYSDKVVFSEPTHSGLNISGKNQYIGVSKVLKIAMNTYFQHPSLTIVGMRQIPLAGGGSSTNNGDPESRGGQSDKGNGGGNPLDVEHNKSYDVFIRWVFEGLPRHTEIIGGCESRYEGEFRYRMDPKSGLIALHEVTSIHPAPPTGFLSKTGLARWAGWLSPRGSLSLSKNTAVCSPANVPLRRCSQPKRNNS